VPTLEGWWYLYQTCPNGTSTTCLTGTSTTCPTGTSTTCPTGTGRLEQVVLVPVGQARCLYQACPTGSRKGQKRPVPVPWTGHIPTLEACPCRRTGPMPTMKHVPVQLVPFCPTQWDYKAVQFFKSSTKVKRGHDSARPVFTASRHHVSQQNFMWLIHHTSMSRIADFRGAHIGIQCVRCLRPILWVLAHGANNG